MLLNHWHFLNVHSVCHAAFCMSRVTMVNLKPEKQHSPLHRSNLGMRTFLRALSPQVNPANPLASKLRW